MRFLVIIKPYSKITHNTQANLYKNLYKYVIYAVKIVYFLQKSAIFCTVILIFGFFRIQS